MAKASEGEITGSETVTIERPTRMREVKRLVVSYDRQTATSGTITKIIRGSGMVDGHAPANNVFNAATTTARQFELVGGEPDQLVLTAASLNNPVKYRVVFY